LLDKLPTLPKDLLHEAPGYYSAEALTRLYAVEAKIIAISQHLEKDNSKWCLEKRQEKLSQFRKRKEDAVSKALITLKTDYQTQLHALIIIPVRLWIKRSGYYNEAGLKTLSAIEEDIKLSYYNLNMNYDNWCETERDKVLAQYKVSGSSIAAKIGIPAAIFMGVTGTGTSYLTSMGDIEQFEQNISLGEQSIEAGDYIKALTFFHDAKSEYNASFRSRHYEEIADKHISEGLDKLVEKSLDLINQGHLLEANKLLKSVPEETILTEDMSRLTNAREVLSKEVNNGIDNLIQNISQNKGHLDDKAKQQLEELLSLNPTDYWLNFLKTKEL